jgi:hypothetical protein
VSERRIAVELTPADLGAVALGLALLAERLGGPAVTLTRPEHVIAARMHAQALAMRLGAIAAEHYTRSEV